MSGVPLSETETGAEAMSDVKSEKIRVNMSEKIRVILTITKELGGEDGGLSDFYKRSFNLTCVDEACQAKRFFVQELAGIEEYLRAATRREVL